MIPEQWPPVANPPITTNTQQLDETVPRSHFSPWSSSNPTESSSHNNHAIPSPDAMDILNSPSPAHMDIHTNIEPTGRMPTPIQPNFASQVRGYTQHAWNGTAGRNGLVNMGHQQTGFNHQQTHANASQPSWQELQHHRSLPSPISEGDHATMELPQVIIDESPHHHCSDQRVMQHPNAGFLDGQRLLQITEMTDAEPGSPSPPRKGHTRSIHTINSWTCQPGMKRSFSIGYRSDCDKCRDKVPGHFNHIIVS